MYLVNFPEVLKRNPSRLRKPLEIVLGGSLSLRNSSIFSSFRECRQCDLTSKALSISMLMKDNPGID